MKRISKPNLMPLDNRKVHPLVYLSRHITTAEIGKLLGHKNHSTASIYVSKARRKPTTTIPAEWVLPLARYLGVRPAALRPDLYLPEWALTS